MITVDGSYLEGGGQILRNATTLSVILNTPVRVHNIRAGRSQDGLRAQHLTSVHLLAEFSEGKLDNANIGSIDIQFTPKTIKSGNYIGNTKTAGSVCLMMQTAIPCLLFANGPSELQLLGGTNTEFAPDIDYYEMIFKPIVKRFNFNFDLKIMRRGYYPKGGGDVRITINPIDELTAIDLTDFGQIKRFFGRSFVAGNLSKETANEMTEAAEKLIRKNYSSEIPIEIEIVKEPENMITGTASGIMIAAETTTGCLLAANALGKRGVAASDVGIQATEELLKDLSHNACVDRYLEDQLIILMALAKGYSKIRCGPLSDRTKTAIYVIEHLTNVKFQTTEIPSTANDKELNSSIPKTLNSTTLIECYGLGYHRHISMSVKSISDGGLKKELERAGDKLVFVDFFATWCGPCKMVAPAIDKLSSSYPNAVFLKVDVDQCQTEAQQYRIEAMPTFVFFRQSKELERIRGADTRAIEATLTKYYKEASAFGGTGHSMLENNSTTKTTTSTTIETDRNRLEQVAQERFSKVKEGQTMTTIRLRLPDTANPINLHISTDKTLNDIRQLLRDTMTEFKTTTFEFIEPPAMKIKLEDEKKTINDAKLMNAVLTVKKT